MSVLHVSASDLAGGGAAIAAYRLHRLCLSENYASRMYVKRKISGDDKVTAFSASARLSVRLRRRRKRLQLENQGLAGPQIDKAYYLHDDRTSMGDEPLNQLPDSRVINLHWISEFIDMPAMLPALARRAPLVWTLHDMFPLTGGCHYDNGCGRYTQQCGRCPGLHSSDPKDATHESWQRKMQTFEKIPTHRLHFVALNQWMADAIKASPLTARFDVSIIPNGVHHEDFAPRDRKTARELFRIPLDARVVLFVAHTLESPRKGFGVLTKALAEMSRIDRMCLVSVGGAKTSFPPDLEHLHLGSIQDERILSAVYSAADVFVIPSLEDNQPNTVTESMACGTPVIGFDVGGIGEMVRPNVTGLLCPRGDAQALAHAIGELLPDETRLANMSQACRKVAVEDYAPKLQVQRYLNLYEHMIAGVSASGDER